jgi:hypothetical protein
MSLTVSAKCFLSRADARSGPFRASSLRGQENVAKGSDLAAEKSVVAGNLTVNIAPGGIDDAGSVRKSFGAVLDQAVNGEVFTQVLEEVFLALPRERR